MTDWRATCRLFAAPRWLAHQDRHNLAGWSQPYPSRCVARHPVAEHRRPSMVASVVARRTPVSAGPLSTREFLRGEPAWRAAWERPVYRLSITLLSLAWTSNATSPRAGFSTACIDAIGSTAATSTLPGAISCTMTLQGSIVPIKSSS